MQKLGFFNLPFILFLVNTHTFYRVIFFLMHNYDIKVYNKPYLKIPFQVKC